MLDFITMDFVEALTWTSRDIDSIWVIINQLTKLANFLIILSSFSIKRLTRIYINEVVYINGMSVFIISNGCAHSLDFGGHSR